MSLVDDRGKITIPRTPFSSLGEYKVLLDPSYDGMLTLSIFSPPENGFIEPYSGLSLQVFKSAALGLPVNVTLPFSSFNPQLLGALNVVFDPHSTRNLRFANPSAVELRESKNCLGKDDCHCPGKPDDCAIIPVTKPAATGWWFRAAVNDINKFPHTAPGGYSPGSCLL